MKKHTHYDSTEMRALKNSAIPAAIMASPGTRFDSAEAPERHAVRFL